MKFQTSIRVFALAGAAVALLRAAPATSRAQNLYGANFNNTLVGVAGEYNATTGAKIKTTELRVIAHVRKAADFATSIAYFSLCFKGMK
jgi:hypothetical protein